MNPYLIAHKVRGEAAFDIAGRMDCPMCHSMGHGPNEGGYSTCHECDGLGYWWIIPTSGHRAHPYWAQDLDSVISDANLNAPMQPPDGWPDHYPCNKTPTQPLLSLLGMLHKEPKVTRR